MFILPVSIHQFVTFVSLHQATIIYDIINPTFVFLLVSIHSSLSHLYISTKLQLFMILLILPLFFYLYLFIHLCHICISPSIYISVILPPCIVSFDLSSTTVSCTCVLQLPVLHIVWYDSLMLLLRPISDYGSVMPSQI